MASVILDIVVPGSGSIAGVLVTIFELCNEMKESQRACAVMHGRLSDVFVELQKMEKANQLPESDSLHRYVQILATYLEYLQKYRAKPLYVRLLQHNKMKNELGQLDDDLNAFMRLLNIATTRSMMQWKQQWALDAQAAAENNELLLSGFRTGRDQQEAMLSLLYSIANSKDGDETIKPAKAMLAAIAQASQTEVPVLPTWFIPRDHMEYETKPFAHGSFGALHRGKWGSDTDVVVKTLLLEETGATEAAIASFRKEIEIWFSLNHPNVIRMYGACHISSPPFIVCAEATNGDLANYLSTASKERPRAMWRLLYEAALGLQYLHKKRVVHGDLKLNNILVGSDGVACVADFGMSFVRASSVLSAMPTLAAPTAGGLRWRAPECLQRRPTFASDVYSLAMCVIEAVTGEPPFAYTDDQTVFTLLRNGNIPTKPDNIPEEAWEMVQAMTTLEPAKRSNVASVLVTLKRLSEAEKAALGHTTSGLRGTAIESVSIDLAIDTDFAEETDRRPLHHPPGLDADDIDPFSLHNVNATTEIKDLVAVLRNGAEGDAESAAKWVYRHAQREVACQQIKQTGGYRLLVHSIRDGDVSFAQQVYAFGALYRMWATCGGVEKSEVVDLGGFVLRPTRADLESLLAAIESPEEDEESAVEAIEKLTCLALASPKNQDLFRKYGLIPQLVRVLRIGTDVQLTEATIALVGLAEENAANQEAIGQAGAILLLVSQLEIGTAELKTQSITALCVLAQSVANGKLIATAGAAAHLVESFRDVKSTHQEKAARLLAVLVSCDQSTRSTVATKTTLVSVMTWMRQGTDSQQDLAATILSHLVRHKSIPTELFASMAPRKRVVELLTDGSDALKVTAARIVRDLVRSKYCESCPEALEPLQKMLLNGTDQQKAIAARVWLQIKGDEQVDGVSCLGRRSVIEASATALVDGLVNGSDQQKEEAAWTIAYLVCDCHLCQEHTTPLLVDAGAVAPLVALLSNGSDIQKEHAAHALGELTRRKNAYRKAAIEAGAVAPLVEMLQCASPTERQAAVFALGSLSKNRRACRQVEQFDGVPQLRKLSKATTGETAELAQRTLSNGASCCTAM